MHVKKAWQFLLHSREKGYFTGYKGAEMFGELDRAKVYRTHGEAHMAMLGIKESLSIESVLLWHREENTERSAPTLRSCNLPQKVTASERPQRAAVSAKQRHLKVVPIQR